MATTTLTAGADTNLYWPQRYSGSGTKSGATVQIGNTIDAGAGIDTLYIDDSYLSGGYTLAESAAGVVTITTASGSVNVTNFEKIQFTNVTINLGTSGNDTITGTAKNDTILWGFAGDDTINGGAGNDKMYGGTGNDVYFVDSATDTVTENLNEGTSDTVNASVTYTLTANVENLTLIEGAGTLSGTGNTLDNILTGNSAANTLTGLAGNDTLDGGAGADTMAGGANDDIYIVDNAGDIVTELAPDGIDTIKSSITYSLADTDGAGANGNVENLTLTGTANIDGTGNGLANTITGNSGANIIDGGTGADTLVGGAGNDTYIVDNVNDAITEAATSGTDTVKSSAAVYTLAANVENLEYTGSAAFTGTGNTLANVIKGGALGDTLNASDGDDIITGGAGNDTIDGGFGSDTVVLTGAAADYTFTSIDATHVRIVDGRAGGDGTDVITGVELIQYAGGTTVTLQELLAGNAIKGDAGDNNLVGTSSGDTMIGYGGNDTLTGGLGVDTMIGGAGDDTYVVDDAAESPTEIAGEGTHDEVQASVSYTLGANIENLTLTGTAANATGNDAGNVIKGNASANMIDGGIGIDSMSGGGGNDTYIVNETGDAITEIAGDGTDEVWSSVTHTLSAEVEKLTLTGTAGINGTGNALANIITGNGAANILDGGADSALDTLTGGLGNDTYVLRAGSDTVTDTGGSDTITSTITRSLAGYAAIENLTLEGTSAINATGNALVNVVTGNGAANLLDGGADSVVDTLAGGLGNDTYVLGSGGDTVTDTGGVDAITSIVTRSLAGYAAIENLILEGTAAINGAGNALVNNITGNAAANLLDGGTDSVADTLAGGLGNDTYVLRAGADTVTDTGGIDTITTIITRSLAGYATIDALTLGGSAAINGTGNTLVNVITGNAAANILSGGADAVVDTLLGGLGNDTYVLDAGTDTVTDTGGLDTITSTITRSLIGYTAIENLTLTGAAAVNATGNVLNNIIIGNSGANIITGGAGHDVMTGGAGKDTFDFNLITETTKVATTRDFITDFTHLTDRIDLSTIDANTKLAGNQAFSLLTAAGAAFKGVAGQLHYLVSGGNTIIEGDINGDKVADFQIQLNGIKTLSAADFVL